MIACLGTTDGSTCRGELNDCCGRCDAHCHCRHVDLADRDLQRRAEARRRREIIERRAQMRVIADWTKCYVTLEEAAKDLGIAVDVSALKKDGGWIESATDTVFVEPFNERGGDRAYMLHVWNQPGVRRYFESCVTRPTVEVVPL